MKRGKAGHKNFSPSLAKNPSIHNPSLLIPYYMKFSRQVYFAILRKFYNLHFKDNVIQHVLELNKTTLSKLRKTQKRE